MLAPVNFDIVYFVQRTCGPSWRLPPHTHPYYGLVILLEGEAAYRLDGEERVLHGGEFLLTRPGTTRAATTSGMACAAIDFAMRQGSIDLPLASPYQRSGELEHLIREFQYEWLQKAENYEWKCSALFLLILHTLLYGKAGTGANYHVERIKRHIVDHFAEPVRVGELADMVGLSAVYCGALFRKTQGMTIAEFANRIRVSKAAALLEEGGHNISETAYLCGFNDVYYFSGTFKRIMGLSPSRYKEHLRLSPPREWEELLGLLKD